METRSDLWPRPGESVLCALSGGLDSVCLLHMLSRRCEKGCLTAAHFNHRLRPTADRDEDFVRSLCRDWDIPLVTGREDVAALARREGLSVEEAARKARYAFLYRASDRLGGAAIYTAHHGDDNAETVLLNLVRGTGLRGLTGIPPCRDRLRRPLLDSSRAQLADYAAAHGLPHVEDETNADPEAAARNLLRLQVLPLLRQLNPRVVEHIGETAAQLALLDGDLDRAASALAARAEAAPGRVSLPLAVLTAAPASLRPRLLLELFDLLGVGRRDVGAVHLRALDALADKGSGHLDLPCGAAARCGGDCLVLETVPPPPAEAPLLPEVPLAWGDFTLTLRDRRCGPGLALAAGETALTVAPCPPGGRLSLPGARGSRSVKRLCVDRGLSPRERDRLPAIYAGGALAAVWQLGVDVRFLPQGGPCRFIQITKEETEYEK